MSLQTLVTMKRAALQSRIDALNAREAKLSRKLAELAKPDDGALDQAGGFQRAAMARNAARSATLQVSQQRAELMKQRDSLLRERLTLDIASEKLDKLSKAAKQLEASRADLKG